MFQEPNFRCVFAAIVAVVIMATVYDNYSAEDKNQWIEAFSLKKNWNSLIRLKKSHDDIEAIHGIRFVNAFFLVLAHKSMAMFFTPYMNRTEMIEVRWSSHRSTIWCK